MPIAWKDFHRLCYVPWVEDARKKLQDVKPSDEYIRKIAEEYDAVFNGKPRQTGWRCDCGRSNFDHATTCGKCGRDKGDN
jgi:hypothetical protein